MHGDLLCQFFGQIDTQIVDHLCSRQWSGEQRNVFLIADSQNVRRSRQSLSNDEGRWFTCDQFGSLVSARGVGKALVILGFLMAKNLDASRVDQIQVADLISSRCSVAGNEAFAARETGEPA